MTKVYNGHQYPATARIAEVIEAERREGRKVDVMIFCRGCIAVAQEPDFVMMGIPIYTNATLEADEIEVREGERVLARVINIGG